MFNLLKKSELSVTSTKSFVLIMYLYLFLCDLSLTFDPNVENVSNQLSQVWFNHIDSKLVVGFQKLSLYLEFTLFSRLSASATEIIFYLFFFVILCFVVILFLAILLDKVNDHFVCTLSA